MIIFSLILSVLPIMFAAHLFKANNNSFLHCLFASFIASLVSFLINLEFEHLAVQIAIMLTVTTVVFSYVLDTSLQKAGLIALLASAIQIIASLLINML